MNQALSPSRPTNLCFLQGWMGNQNHLNSKITLQEMESPSTLTAKVMQYLGS